MTAEEIQQLLTMQPILLFDGECGFCNRSVQFFLKRERNKCMHFAPLQSKAGIALRSYFEISEKTDSIILIKNHAAYIKSCAALRLAPYMKGLWPALIILVAIPPFIRNAVYDLIASRRMKLFGRVQNCALLDKEDQQRLLDK